MEPIQNNLPPPTPLTQKESSVKLFFRIFLPIVVLIVLGTGAWFYFYVRPSAFPSVVNLQKPQALPGELDFYSLSPIIQTAKPPLSGVLKYNSGDGVSAILSESYPAVFFSASLSPLRDMIAYVSQASSTAPTYGSVLSLYSLVTKKTIPLTKSSNSIMTTSWSGDASTIVYMQLSLINGTTTPVMTKVFVGSSKSIQNLGAGVPVALSYNGSEILYSTPDARLYIASSTLPGIPVSEKLSFASKADQASPISVAVSPDREYVAILGSAKTFIARIDWRNNKLDNPTMLPVAYESGVFDQKNELLLAKTDGTADLYTVNSTGFTKGISYIVPKLTSPATLLGWETTTP